MASLYDCLARPALRGANVPEGRGAMLHVYGSLTATAPRLPPLPYIWYPKKPVGLPLLPDQSLPKRGSSDRGERRDGGDRSGDTRRQAGNQSSSHGAGSAIPALPSLAGCPGEVAKVGARGACVVRQCQQQPFGGV